MFTWICPTCGREVPPAYDECPDCAAKGKAGAPAASTAAPPAAAPGPPVPAAAAPQAMPYAVPPPRAALPTWLMAVLFALAFAGLGGGVYFLARYFGGGTQTASTAPIVSAPKSPAQVNELQKYIEVSGIRFVENAKHETEARFVVTNHSGADISDLGGSVNIWGRTDKSEEEAAGSFTFQLPSLGAYGIKEATAPVKTKLKVYELPDWQNVSTEVQITSPK